MGVGAGAGRDGVGMRSFCLSRISLRDGERRAGRGEEGHAGTGSFCAMCAASCLPSTPPLPLMRADLFSSCSCLVLWQRALHADAQLPVPRGRGRHAAHQQEV